MHTAADYVRETSLSMSDRYQSDCVTHCCRIAELLMAERLSPWIGRLRDVVVDGDRRVHLPLMPRRYTEASSVVWNTHYIACTGQVAYDPLAGAPIDIAQYAPLVFGREIAIEMHLDTGEIERLLKSGEIRRRFRPPEA